MRLIPVPEAKRLTLSHPFLLFCLTLFFVLLSDSIMSYYFPIVVENSTGSNSLMGIIMALSSGAGLLCDLIFPQIFRKNSWKMLLMAGIVIASLFSTYTNLGVKYDSILMFVIATVIWGIYFELLSFSQQDYIVSNEKKEHYSRDWSLITIFWGIAMVLGPIIGSSMVKMDLFSSNIIPLTMVLIAFGFSILLSFVQKSKAASSIDQESQRNLFKEPVYWWILFRRLWPIIILGLFYSLINATFWTIGGVFGEEILGHLGLDWIIAVASIIPLIPASIILAKLQIHEHKKKYAQLSLLISGLFLALIYLFAFSNILVILLVLVASFFLSLVAPLTEAVYSDLQERAGDFSFHITAITRANTSLGFIIGPLLAGYLADAVGYHGTLAIVGVVGSIVAGVLLFVTPRKLKLPQIALKNLN